MTFGAPVPGKADKIDHYITAQMERLHIPASSLGIVRDGRITKAQGYRFANLELKSPATKDTVYEFGSISKQFTATAIMTLVEQGKVRLDDTITKYFPEVPQAWRGITIRDLLTHTSGIQNHVAVPHWLDVFKTNLAFETAPSRDELLKMFFKLPLEFQPGETWEYDNTGYYLLGIIIEKVSGKSYWQFLDERIFKPLGMNATRSTDPQPIVRNRASGYEWKNDHFENRPVLLPAIAFSAGSLLSSVEDIAKWDAALYTEKLLKNRVLFRFGRPLQPMMGRPHHSITVSAGSSTATMVTASSSTAAERRVFRQSFTDSSMTTDDHLSDQSR